MLQFLVWSGPLTRPAVGAVGGLAWRDGMNRANGQTCLHPPLRPSHKHSAPPSLFPATQRARPAAQMDPVPKRKRTPTKVVEAMDIATIRPFFTVPLSKASKELGIR